MRKVLVRPTVPELEAMYFTAEVGKYIANWCGGEYRTYRDENENFVAYIVYSNDDGKAVLEPGDWLVYDPDTYGFETYTDDEFEFFFNIINPSDI